MMIPLQGVPPPAKKATARKMPAKKASKTRFVDRTISALISVPSSLAFKLDEPVRYFSELNKASRPFGVPPSLVTLDQPDREMIPVRRTRLLRPLFDKLNGLSPEICGPEVTSSSQIRFCMRTRRPDRFE